MPHSPLQIHRHDVRRGYHRNGSARYRRVRPTGFLRTLHSHPCRSCEVGSPDGRPTRLQRCPIHVPPNQYRPSNSDNREQVELPNDDSVLSLPQIVPNIYDDPDDHLASAAAARSTGDPCVVARYPPQLSNRLSFCTPLSRHPNMILISLQDAFLRGL